MITKAVWARHDNLGLKTHDVVAMRSRGWLSEGTGPSPRPQVAGRRTAMKRVVVPLYLSGTSKLTQWRTSRLGASAPLPAVAHWGTRLAGLNGGVSVFHGTEPTGAPGFLVLANPISSADWRRAGSPPFRPRTGFRSSTKHPTHPTHPTPLCQTRKKS